MRAFFLVDPANPTDEYSLTLNTHFLYSPSGLGFEEENTYRQIGGNFVLANSKPKQSVISGNIHFGGSTPYSRYRDFLAYCARPNIQLAYYTGEATSKDQQRTVYKIYAGTSYEEEYNGHTNIIPGVLQIDTQTVLGQPYTRTAANASYEMQTKALEYTHLIVSLNQFGSLSVKQHLNSHDMVEAKTYSFPVFGIKADSEVFCNLLPYYENTYDGSKAYYTNQVFKSISMDTEITANNLNTVTYDGNTFWWNGSSWRSGNVMGGYYLGESKTEIVAGGTNNTIHIDLVNILFCIREDTLAGKTLAEWVESATDKGLLFYCEKAGGE